MIFSNKKIVTCVCALFLGVMLLGLTIAEAAQSTQTASIDDCNITISNSISADKKRAVATTSTNKYDALASVSATFYYLNTDTNVVYQSGASNGGQGGAGVEKRLIDSSLIHYKVISSHTVSYHDATFSNPALKTVID